MFYYKTFLISLKFILEKYKFYVMIVSAKSKQKKRIIFYINPNKKQYIKKAKKKFATNFFFFSWDLQIFKTLEQK